MFKIGWKSRIKFKEEVAITKGQIEFYKGTLKKRLLRYNLEEFNSIIIVGGSTGGALYGEPLYVQITKNGIIHKTQRRPFVFLVKEVRPWLFREKKIQEDWNMPVYYDKGDIICSFDYYDFFYDLVTNGYNGEIYIESSIYDQVKSDWDILIKNDILQEQRIHSF